MSTPFDNDIKTLEENARIAMAALSAARNKRREYLAQRFILANNITLNKVELSQGEEKPWFGMVGEFSEWLRENSNKRFAEWNERIYFTADLVAGRFPQDEMPATIKDLQR